MNAGFDVLINEGRIYNRRPDPQTGLESFGIVDQSRGLTSEVFIDRMQRMPQLARRHPLRVLAALVFEDMHDLADALDAALGVLRLAVPNAPMQTFDLGDNHSLRDHPVRGVGRQIRCRQLGGLQTHRDVSGSRASLPKPSPLRTGRDPHGSSGSSLSRPVPVPHMVRMMAPPVYQLDVVQLICSATTAWFVVVFIDEGDVLVRIEPPSTHRALAILPSEQR